MHKRTHKQPADTRVPLRVPVEMLAAVDRVAGRGRRSEWIRAAIESALAAEQVRRTRAELDRQLEALQAGSSFFEGGL